MLHVEHRKYVEKKGRAESKKKNKKMKEKQKQKLSTSMLWALVTFIRLCCSVASGCLFSMSHELATHIPHTCTLAHAVRQYLAVSRRLLVNPHIQIFHIRPVCTRPVQFDKLGESVLLWLLHCCRRCCLALLYCFINPITKPPASWQANL